MIQMSSTGEWITVKEIAKQYRISPQHVRNKLSAAIKNLSENEKGKVRKKRSGPHGHLLNGKFVISVFGQKPPQELGGFSKLPIDLDSLPKVPMIGPDSKIINSQMAILQSRSKSPDEYNALLEKMIESRDGLRIRCMTGRDIFDSRKPVGKALWKRASKELEAKILLVHPMEKGAECRCRAENEPILPKSQFVRDARSSLHFLRSYSAELFLNARWTSDLPSSFLVWTKDFAILELYDYGHNPEDSSNGCIAGISPMMIIGSKMPYHETLRIGFDYVFNGPYENTHIKTSSLDQVKEVLTT